MEDVFQETFLKLCKFRHRYKTDLPFLPWFFTLCRNTMLDALRKRRDREELVSTSQIESFAAGAVLAAETSPDYASYLNSLSERERTVLELHFIQDLPFKAVAGRLGMSGASVRKVSSRAIQKLRSIWKG